MSDFIDACDIEVRIQCADCFTIEETTVLFDTVEEDIEGFFAQLEGDGWELTADTEGAICAECATPEVIREDDQEADADLADVVEGGGE